MIVQKQNESYTLLISENLKDNENLKQIHEFLKSEKGDAKYNFKIQRGWESPYIYYTEVKKNGEHLVLRVLNGHLELLESFGVKIEKEQLEFTEQIIDETLNNIVSMMPFEPYDYQLKLVKDSLLTPKQIGLSCTSSGKSLAIFMIMYFMYKNNKKGYIIVPNINLLQQLYSDFADYFSSKYTKEREEFLSHIQLQGGGKESSFDTFLTITTWQSLMNKREVLARADFILCDEVHKYSSEMTSEIVRESSNAKYKWGVTGTMPEDPGAKLMLIGIFGAPKRYIRACELIERGLATPVEIISFVFKYQDNDKRLFSCLPKGQYVKQLGFIKEHEQRNKFITDLTLKVKNTGNSLLLGSHTAHLKETFISLMSAMYPGVVVENKHITGKKSFEFQCKYGIYFLNGEDDALTRELTRKILEEKHYIFEFEDSEPVHYNENDLFEGVLVKDLVKDDSLYKELNIKNITLRNEILVSNYQLLSTGISIKRLFNLIMFSPLKSYTTITQSIGRGLRLHPDKKVFRCFDLVDDFGLRKPGGIFWKQYQERQRHSYNSEGYPLTEKEFYL